MTVKNNLLLGMVCLLGLCGGVARADGVADMRAALGRLQGQATVRAVVEAKTTNRQGEGKEMEEQTGQVSIAIDDSPRGLQLSYGKDVLARLETEERAKEKDAKAKTPTIAAIREVNASELRPMIFAAANLTRLLERAVFKTEKADTYNGKPARLLSFETPVEKLTEKERKYVKKFENTLDIWIAADGTPLASRMRQSISGRAFVVISFETKNDEDLVYSVTGDRLIVVRKEIKTSGAGAGEKGEMHVIKTLQLQS
ncbi:hypothetical protein [Undibacterium sp. TJN19]|uniref:hypothetical protein n=1 Tax=Undibacterium sp. TJN19 TaxID=3413055 RepID=UPI003BF394B6